MVSWLRRSSSASSPMVHAHCDNCVLFWNDALFWNGVVTFYLLLGMICCGKIALRGQGTRLQYIIFVCICAAILAALSYATSPPYMLVAILVGSSANAALFWALGRVIPSLEPQPGARQRRPHPDRDPRAHRSPGLQITARVARPGKKRRFAASSGTRHARMVIAG